MSEDLKFPSQLAERFQIRMPDGLRDRLRAAAEGNSRSMNTEIVVRLESSLLGETESTIDTIYPEVLKRMLGAKKPPTGLQLQGVSARYIDVKMREQDALREFFDYTANVLRDLNGEEPINLNPKLEADWVEKDLKKRAQAHGYKLVPLNPKP